MLLALLVMAFILAAVGPYLLTEAVLQIVFPFTFVLCTVLMDVNSVPIGLVVYPFAFKNIAIDMPELASAACLIKLPISFVFRSILPLLAAVAMLHVSIPLAYVGGPIFKLNFIALLKLVFIDVL